MNNLCSTEERAAIFEDTLAEFIEEFSEKRIASTYCSEADVRVHLIHKLLTKLPQRDVHAELRVPLDVKSFGNELWGRGRVSSCRCVKADIAIIDSENLYPQIIAELKFTPLRWGFIPLIQAPLSRNIEFKRIMLDSLRRDLDLLQRLRRKKPSQEDVERTYLGWQRIGPTTVEKMIQIINNFERTEKRDVRGYLCVFDEIYPNIEEILSEAIDRYELTDNFKVVATYFDVSQALQDTLEELTKELTKK